MFQTLLWSGGECNGIEGGQGVKLEASHIIGFSGIPRQWNTKETDTKYDQNTTATAITSHPGRTPRLIIPQIAEFFAPPHVLGYQFDTYRI